MIETKKSTDGKNLNKKGNRKPIDTRYLAILETLREKFPEAFPDSEIRILKVGIHKDIKKGTDLKGFEISKFFHKYCNSKKYKEAHVEGANRYDLDGNAVGVVTAEEVAKKQKPPGNTNNNENIKL